MKLKPKRKQTEQDRRAQEAMVVVRRLMTAQWGISTDDLSDEEVFALVSEKVKQFVETVGPILDTLREAGLLVEEGGE